MNSNPGVVIVGAGPVGLTLGHFLGRAGVSTVILEKAGALCDQPRAVALDPESLRVFQSLDLLPALDGEILFGLTGEYVNGRGEQLFELEDDSPGPMGYPYLNGINQPGIVRVLAAELNRYPCVDLLFEHELLGFGQDDAAVSIQVRDADGAELELRADFLVGCDGGRSSVRSTLGIRMQGDSNPLPWLVVDTREARDDGKRRYHFYCDPARPGMFVQTPGAMRRWEWMLLPGEDRDALQSDASIRAILDPYVDLDEVEVVRRQVYDFHSIIAERFQHGRVFLAGDAAHMTPPFAGQGLNAGVRDAANLGWKLAAVLDGAPRSLLESYQQERWQHAWEVIQLAVQLGNDIQPIDPEKAAQRDAGFAMLQRDPAAMQAFKDGILQSLQNRHFAQGAALAIDVGTLSGRMLMQPRLEDGRLLDEVLGTGCCLLGFGCDPAEALPAGVAERWQRHGASIVQIAAGDAGGLVDPSGYFADVMEPGTMVLLRPDRFCMAEFTADNAEARLAEAAAMLGY